MDPKVHASSRVQPAQKNLIMHIFLFIYFFLLLKVNFEFCDSTLVQYEWLQDVFIQNRISLRPCDLQPLSLNMK